MKTRTCLRPYQLELFRACIARLDLGRAVMMQLPTGAGKTVVFSQVAQHFAGQDKKVLVIAHREELICQARQKLKEVTGSNPGIIKARHKPNPRAPIQVASIQTLAARDIAFCPDLLIIDEAHHASAASYQKVMARFPGASLLGATATPWRSDAKGFSEFDDLVCGPTTHELIRQGYLCKYRLFADPLPMSVAGATKSGGDYSVSQLAAHNNVVALSGNLTATWLQECPGKKTLVFAINVSHSKFIAKRFEQMGVPAAHLDASTPPADRKRILRRLEEGRLQVLSSVGLFSEGLDIPSIEVVQVARPTKSLALWLQMVGRALRPCGGKTEALILDHTDNWRRLGSPVEDRQWSLESSWIPSCDRPSGAKEFPMLEAVVAEGEDFLKEVESYEQWMDEFEEANRRFREEQFYRNTVALKIDKNFLADHELESFLYQADRLGPYALAAAALTFFHALREVELSDLIWGDVNLSEGKILLRGLHGERPSHRLDRLSLTALKRIYPPLQQPLEATAASTCLRMESKDVPELMRRIGLAAIGRPVNSIALVNTRAIHLSASGWSKELVKDYCGYRSIGSLPFR